MDIYNDPITKQELIKNLKRYHHMADKREGIHWSDLTGCITKTFWRKVTPDIQVGDQSALFMMSGTAIERGLRAELPSPLEVEVEDIKFNADFYLHNTDTYIEIKSTRMWVKDDELQYGWPKEWIRRIRGYCHAFKKLDWNISVLSIHRAELLSKKFLFTKEEIQNFWFDFALPRRNLLRLALQKEMPPEPYAFTEAGHSQSWECKNCEFRMLCDVQQYNQDEVIKKPDWYKGDPMDSVDNIQI